MYVHPATIVSGVLAPFAVGSILMVMVFMGGTISGGVYNPAVTLALMLRGELPVARAIRYAIVQLVAGIAAGLVGNVMAHVPGSTDACPLVVDNVMRVCTVGGCWCAPRAVALVVVDRCCCCCLCGPQAIVAETVYTCMLCYVVLSVATVGEGNHFFGLAIGMSVGSGAMLVGSVSGGASAFHVRALLSNPALTSAACTGVFNPAVGTGVSVGALIHGCKTISHLYIYWVRWRWRRVHPTFSCVLTLLPPTSDWPTPGSCHCRRPVPYHQPLSVLEGRTEARLLCLHRSRAHGVHWNVSDLCFNVQSRCWSPHLVLLPLATASTLCMLWPSQASLATLVPSQSEHP